MKTQKNNFKIILTTLFLFFCIFTVFSTQAYAQSQKHKVGEQLFSADEGWKRYNDSDSNINYTNCCSTTYYNPGICYMNDCHDINNSSNVKFKFKGSKLRLIGLAYGYNYTNADAIIKIDGNKYSIKEKYTNNQTLFFEKTGLEFKEHSVEITCNPESIVYLDTIDVDKNGELLNANTISLDIEADKYEFEPGTKHFTAKVVIHNAKSLYAEDIKVDYDKDLFEYVSAETTTPSALTIYHENQSTTSSAIAVNSNKNKINGQVRYIVASKGEQYDINGDDVLLTLKFKTKKASGEGQIKISSGLVANGYGEEFSTVCGSKTFRISSYNGDVNKDGRTSLGDIAIASRLYGTSYYEWEGNDPDVDNDYYVDDFDLKEIVNSFVLKNN